MNISKELVRIARLINAFEYPDDLPKDTHGIWRKENLNAKKFIVVLSFFEYTYCPFDEPIKEFNSYDEAKSYVDSIVNDNQKLYSLIEDNNEQVEDDGESYGILDDVTGYSLEIYADRYNKDSTIGRVYMTGILGI